MKSSFIAFLAFVSSHAFASGQCDPLLTGLESNNVRNFAVSLCKHIDKSLKNGSTVEDAVMIFDFQHAIDNVNILGCTTRTEERCVKVSLGETCVDNDMENPCSITSEHCGVVRRHCVKDYMEVCRPISVRECESPEDY